MQLPFEQVMTGLTRSGQIKYKCHIIGEKLLPLLTLWLKGSCLKLDGF